MCLIKQFGEDQMELLAKYEPLEYHELYLFMHVKYNANYANYIHVYFAKRGRWSVMEELRATIPFPGNILYNATKYKQPAVIEYLIKLDRKQPNVIRNVYYWGANTHYWNAFSKAARTGQLQILQLLYKTGISADHLNESLCQAVRAR